MHRFNPPTVRSVLFAVMLPLIATSGCKSIVESIEELFEAFQVTGQIVGEAAGVAGAVVEMVSAAGQKVTTTTDPQGYYLFTEVERGSYTVNATSVTRPDVAGAVTRDIEYRAERNIEVVNEDLDIEPMEMTGALVGQVQLSSNGVTEADSTGIEVYIPGTSFQARTDSDGNFTMLYLQPGIYTVRAERDNYSPLDLTDVTVRSASLSEVGSYALVRKLDSDGDGILDEVDPDDDGDGVDDEDDLFPLDPDECCDTDGDGVGDNADTQLGDVMPTTTGSVTFVFSAAIDDLDYFECSLDGGLYAPCTSPKTYTGLDDGSHTIAVRFVRAAGAGVDPTPATESFTISVPPVSSIDSGPTAETPLTYATFTFSSVSSDLDHFDCKVDWYKPISPGGFQVIQTSYPDCNSPFALTDLEVGQHVFWLSAVDDSGNQQYESGQYTWTVKRRWNSLDAGRSMSCGIATDQTLWCWGRNAEGQLGLGTTGGDVYQPRQASTSPTWSSVAAGHEHACAIDNAAQLWCWGDNAYGQLGLGMTELVPRPDLTQVTGSTWSQVSVGTQFTCGIATDASLWCWGDNSGYQLGLGHQLTVSQPTLVSATTDWAEVRTAIDWGGPHACARKTNGEVWCWGGNQQQRTGIVGPGQVTAPTKVTSTADFVSLSVGYAHTCAVRSGGTMLCWGEDMHGQLGDGGGYSAYDITTVSGSDWVYVDIQGRTSCAQKSTGAVFCWGSNYYGQLGIHDKVGPQSCPSDEACSYAPKAVDVPPTVDQPGTLVTGESHACVIDNQDGAWCWGQTPAVGRTLNGLDYGCDFQSSLSCISYPVRVDNGSPP